MTDPGDDTLAAFLDEQLGDHAPLDVEPMVGGGSCEIFALDRGGDRWVLRRAPAHANTATAHDVLREFRILDCHRGRAVRVPQAGRSRATTRRSSARPST